MALGTDFARKSLADVITLQLLMWSDKQSYEPSAARENMEEEGRLRDEDKWVWLNGGYWFASISRRAEEKEGLPSENKGVCPSPSPFYWSKLRCKPSFQHSHYHSGTKEPFLCFVLMWTCTRVAPLSTWGQKDASWYCSIDMNKCTRRFTESILCHSDIWKVMPLSGRLRMVYGMVKGSLWKMVLFCGGSVKLEVNFQICFTGNLTH